MWARVENNIVVEITEIDPEGRFHESVKWEKCKTCVKEGWYFNGKTFKEPSPTISNENVDNLRKLAYSNPHKGSDYLFSQALRMREMGESGWELVRERAIQRFIEIQKEFPWLE